MARLQLLDRALLATRDFLLGCDNSWCAAGRCRSALLAPLCTALLLALRLGLARTAGAGGRHRCKAQRLLLLWRDAVGGCHRPNADGGRWAGVTCHSSINIHAALRRGWQLIHKLLLCGLRPSRL